MRLARPLRMARSAVATALAVLGYGPVVFVVLILALEMYTYVFSVLPKLVAPSSVAAAAVFGTVFCVLWVLTAIGFFRAAFTAPGAPPLRFKMSEEEYAAMMALPMDALPAYLRDRLGESTALVIRGMDRRPRYCVPCGTLKPDRCHHCSTCDKCVLKMDHHCFWINTCVGWGNHRFFLQMTATGFLLALWTLATSLPYVIPATRAGVAPPTESTVRIIALALAGMFTGVLSIFAGQHTLIILRNKTQVEDIVSVANQRGRWIFDIGRAANWRQVMGPHWWQWVLPVAFRGTDGINYPNSAGRAPEEGSDESSLLRPRASDDADGAGADDGARIV